MQGLPVPTGMDLKLLGDVPIATTKASARDMEGNSVPLAIS